ncbi:MAG: TIGR02300 family protein [Alphaproteobacteria bacterium]|nr:TIGR02300 family protein [Alphaproteobacteria bacterium]
MSKPEWGLKRTCLSCGAKFYDMKRDPIVCPKCGTAFDPEAATKLKRGRPAPEEKAKPKPAADLVEDESLDDDEKDADDTVLEDTSDLDDDGDVPGVAAAEEDDES